MICWSCQKNAGPDLLCASCGAIQPPDPRADHFAVLGVPRQFETDRDALEVRYKDLSKKVHPDRFARAAPEARRASLARSVQVNEAYRALVDPVRRTEYLLSLAGTTIPAAVPEALLTEMLELRSALGEARLAGDDAKVTAMAADMRLRAARGLGEIRAAFGAGDHDRAARELVALRYVRRFLDEVAVHEDGKDAVAHA